jgi:hypothetical protein
MLEERFLAGEGEEALSVLLVLVVAGHRLAYQASSN